MTDPLSAADPLDHPDPLLAADALAAESLLRAYVRETGTDVPATGEQLVLTMPASGVTLRVPVRHRSATGWHRFGPARLLTPDGTTAPADIALVAAAAIRETTQGRGAPPQLGADAVGRVLNSAQRTAAHLTARRAEGENAAGPTPFLDSEQALLLGHPFHPAPKSREEASAHELDVYSPELRGSFAPHWFAVHRDELVGESADGALETEVLRPLAEAAGLAENHLPKDTVAIPAHPWQAREILARPQARRLLEEGSLHSLGVHGPHWYPTSSVRTVHRPDAAVMLKLSLGMRITNSRRNNLRGEMRLGVSAARLLAAGPLKWLAAEHPGFGILRDFAWVSAGRGDTETGLETAVRDNPFHGGDTDALCVAGLLAERPGPGDGTEPGHRALLVPAVRRTAAAHGLERAEAASRWLLAYLDAVVTPLIRLQARYGVALEPHHQNTLVHLAPDGLPDGGWYRDSQGYYVAASRAAELERLLPGATDGVEIVFDDSFVDERVAYYLGINNLLGLIGAFGALGLAAEEDLLATARGALERLRATEPGARGLLDLLLDAPVLRCKGNYLTCVDGLDELVGDVHTQSVYIDLPNPLAEALR
ncbi:IucA/IucC family protein [Streptomyces alkaliterrae]|uniref:Siderophore biosynthesis protein n=1 Tax=Streptomyces alkaliterrae TaxID=2213162 RepID=A0A5P0YVH6_9ACTN|nr:IucA/IucC family protein [Streptomyces alkaliterrae]MBB1261070.1 siderophore biosynthesis protein [Streptomyces alkaliterrae]MQS04294.1 siderophore biosynthesis protein [Streptomyces alkaliterrae]